MSIPEPGDVAPEVALPDESGTIHRLSDQRGRWTILYFYPKDDTPGCTVEACEFRDANDTIVERGADAMIALARKAVHRAGLVFEGDLRSLVANRGHVHRESVTGVSTTRTAPPSTATDACSPTRTFDTPRAVPRASVSRRSG